MAKTRMCPRGESGQASFPSRATSVPKSYFQTLSPLSLTWYLSWDRSRASLSLAGGGWGGWGTQLQSRRLTYSLRGGCMGRQEQQHQKTVSVARPSVRSQSREPGLLAEVRISRDRGTGNSINIQQALQTVQASQLLLPQRVIEASKTSFTLG